MTDDEWIESRILWRAGQNTLFDLRCTRFIDLPESVQHNLRSAHAHKGQLVLAFIGDENATWTLVTTQEIVSSYGGKIVYGSLDALDKEITYDTDSLPDGADVKLESNFLQLKSLGISVWVPEGQELHALWGILRMFPIRRTKKK